MQAVQAQHSAQQQSSVAAQESQVAQTQQLHARLKLMEDWAASQAQVRSLHTTMTLQTRPAAKHTKQSGKSWEVALLAAVPSA